MLCRKGGRKLLGLCLGLWAGLWCAGPVAARDGLGTPALKDEFNFTIKTRVDNLIKGSVPYSAKEDKGNSDLAARFYVYQFTWRDTYRSKVANFPQNQAREFQSKMELAAQQAKG